MQCARNEYVRKYLILSKKEDLFKVRKYITKHLFASKGGGGFLTFIITRNTIHWQLHLSALARLSTWTTFSIASIVIGPTLKPFRFNEISSIAHIASVSLG